MLLTIVLWHVKLNSINEDSQAGSADLFALSEPSENPQSSLMRSIPRCEFFVSGKELETTIIRDHPGVSLKEVYVGTLSHVLVDHLFIRRKVRHGNTREVTEGSRSD